MVGPHPFPLPAPPSTTGKKRPQLPPLRSLLLALHAPATHTAASKLLPPLPIPRLLQAPMPHTAASQAPPALPFRRPRSACLAASASFPFPLVATPATAVHEAPMLLIGPCSSLSCLVVPCAPLRSWPCRLAVRSSCSSSVGGAASAGRPDLAAAHHQALPCR